MCETFSGMLIKYSLSINGSFYSIDKNEHYIAIPGKCLITN